MSILLTVAANGKKFKPIIILAGAEEGTIFKDVSQYKKIKYLVLLKESMEWLKKNGQMVQ